MPKCIDYKNVQVKEPLTLKQALKNAAEVLMIAVLVSGGLFVWFLAEVK